MKSSLLLLALAALAVGCGTGSQTPAEGPAASKSEPTATVAQNGGSDSTTVTGAQSTTEPAAPESAKPGEAAATAAPDAAKPTPPANQAAPRTNGAAPGAGGPSANIGGQRGGGPGGPRGGGRGFNVGFMLRNEQFKKELNLTDDQVKQIEAALPQQGQGGGQQISPEERQKQREAIQKKIDAILKPGQKSRLHEIELQMQGPRALTRDEVAKALGLSEDQSKKIEAALQVPRPSGGPGGPGAAPGGPGRQGGGQPGAGGPGGGFDREAFMKAREEANKKALAILTADQKAKWDKMLGKPFEFQRPQGGGPGGPGGPRGGGG